MKANYRKLEITIDGVTYPCAPSMGAMLRFRQETGRQVSEMDPTSFSDLCVFLWCCVASASAREGVPFAMGLMDFADRISPEDMQGWQTAMAERRGGEEGEEDGDGQEEDGDKKKRPASTT